uniref:Uncharacterized protein n=1 Tax=Parascaris equorum TaxID=6256 RepID=A0A914RG17_PAREQ
MRILLKKSTVRSPLVLSNGNWLIVKNDSKNSSYRQISSTITRLSLSFTRRFVVTMHVNSGIRQQMMQK